MGRRPHRAKAGPGLIRNIRLALRSQERDELRPTRREGLCPRAFQGHLGGRADAVCAQPGARRGGPAQEPAPLGRRSRHRRRFRLRQARRVLLHVGRRAQAQLRHSGRGAGRPSHDLVVLGSKSRHRHRSRQARASIGADYIVVHAPVLHFAHKQDDTLYQYYQTISEQVEIGIALWSHPDSGYLMSPELCARVADIPNVVAIKYSVPRDMYARLTRLAGDKILVSTASEEEWFDNIAELGWRLYLCSSPPYLLQTKADRRMREYTDLAFCGEVARAKAVRDSLDPVREAIRRTRPAEKFHDHSKCWQELLGQTGGAVRRPLLELTPAERDATRRAQRALVGGLSERGRNMRRLQAFNFQSWIKENQHLLKPPVGNKKVFEDGEMTVQVVGGPNERTDYHDDPVEEFFYQLKGDMLLKVVDDGNFYDVPIREGEVFLLPAHVRHCPQRPQEGSVGLVVEAARPDELDAFEWYCFECHALVHRIEVKV